MTNRNFLIGLTVLAITALISLTSCFPEDNHGFPSKVNFSSDGGSEIIKGETNWLAGINIYEGKQLIDGVPVIRSFDDSVASYKWLTLRRVPSEYSKIELIAAPNETNKKRVMTLELEFVDSWGQIRVTQKGR